jgi:hypothetical protein
VEPLQQQTCCIANLPAVSAILDAEHRGDKVSLQARSIEARASYIDQLKSYARTEFLRKCGMRANQ